MRKKFKVSQGFDVIVRWREKTFDHDARVEIQLEYSELGNGHDEDEVEKEAQKFAARIDNYIKNMGSISTPAERQFEGEIIKSVKVKEGHTAEQVVRRVESIVSVFRAEMDRQNIQYRTERREHRKASIVSALEGYKGEKLDEPMIGMIAEDILSMLRKGERGR